VSDIQEIYFDQPLVFTISERDVRGRVVRLGPALREILSAHAYPPVAEKLLAEALVLTVLLGSTLKDDGGQMTLQAANGGGPVELLVCDYRGGELRGYLKFDSERLASLTLESSLQELFGEGYMAITFDQSATKERYQGIVPMEGASIASAAEHYFDQSEQIPSLIRLAVGHDAAGECVAGGMLLQYLPEGEVGRERLETRRDRPEWEHVTAIGSTVKSDELVDADVSMETLVWRLFHEDKVRVDAGTKVFRTCRCDIGHVKYVLAQFPEADRLEMAEEDGSISVDCAFCSTVTRIPLSEIATRH
jgi:molecular chaperone Hsp33